MATPGDHADVFTPDACSTSALAVFDDPDCRCSAKFVDLVWDRITSTNRDTRNSAGRSDQNDPEPMPATERLKGRCAYPKRHTDAGLCKAGQVVHDR